MSESKKKTNDSLYQEIVMKRIKINLCDLIDPKPYFDEMKGKNRKVYSAIFILDKVEHADIIKNIYDIEEDLHQKRLIIDKNAKKPDSLLVDGKEKSITYPEYNNSFFFKASKDMETGIIKLFDKNMDPITKEGVIYRGCTVTVSLTLCSYKVGISRGYKAYINKIQLVKRGPLPTVKVNVDNEAFEDYSNEEDEVEMVNTVPFSFDANVINSFDDDDFEKIKNYKM